MFADASHPDVQMDGQTEIWGTTDGAQPADVQVAGMWRKAGAFPALALEQELLEVSGKTRSCREEGGKLFTRVSAHLEAFHTCFSCFLSISLTKINHKHFFFFSSTLIKNPHLNTLKSKSKNNSMKMNKLGIWLLFYCYLQF